MLIALMGLSAENERTQKEALFKALATIGNRRSIIQSAKWCPAEMPFCFGFAIFFNHLLCSSSCWAAFAHFFVFAQKEVLKKAILQGKRPREKTEKVWFTYTFISSEIRSSTAWRVGLARLRLSRWSGRIVGVLCSFAVSFQLESILGFSNHKLLR